jgi:hypothetical protein
MRSVTMRKGSRTPTNKAGAVRDVIRKINTSRHQPTQPHSNETEVKRTDSNRHEVAQGPRWNEIRDEERHSYQESRSNSLRRA